MKLSRLSALASVACASLAFASPAFAGNDRDDPKPTSATATANPTVNNNPTFDNDPRATSTASVIAPNTNTNANTALGGTAVQGQGQGQGQDQGQLQGQGQHQSASSNQGQSQSSTSTQANQQTSTSGASVGAVAPIQNVNISTPKQFRDAPNVQGSVLVNVASCAMADGFSLSVPGGGGNVAKSRVDPACDTRADVSIWLALGLRDVAINRMYGMANKEAYDLADSRRKEIR